jgi:hypothetical protein
MVRRWAFLAAVAAIAVGALSTSAAPPAEACAARTMGTFGMSPGCVDDQILGAPVAGSPTDFTAAGGHPYQMTISMYLNAPDESALGQNYSPETLKDLAVSLPAGVAINPSAAATCSLRQLAETQSFFDVPQCPPASQVGVVEIDSTVFGGGVFDLTGFPLYNITPGPESPARFGLVALNSTLVLEGHLLPGGEGLRMMLPNVNEMVAVVGAKIELWGVPADPRHTPERACPGSRATPGEEEGPTCAAGFPASPLLRTPTSCDAPPVSRAEADSWEQPGIFYGQDVANHLLPGLPDTPMVNVTRFPGLDSSKWGPPQALTGCEQLPFHPSLAVSAYSQEAGAPTGLGIEMSFPQQGLDEIEALSESDLRSARIQFPAGISVNASVANGLGECSAAQVDLGSNAPAACPDSAKLGTAEIHSPILAAPLTGAVYLAQGEDAVGSSLRLPAYLIAEGQGTTVKLATAVRRNEATGRLEASFDSTPQIPLTSMKMQFFDGPRAPFVNPPQCGSYAFDGSFTPWARPEAVAASAQMQVTSGMNGQPCPPQGGAPFTPTLSGGSVSLGPRRSTSFKVSLRRPEGQQEITSFDVSLPRGISATLRGVPRCPDAAIAAASDPDRSGAQELASPSCPASSQVGSFVALMGAGSEPFSLEGGHVYLAGPYQGAGFSLVVIAPALAGPLDLGTLVTRLPVQLDPRSGRIEISGSLPSTQRGIRLGLRRITLDIDRPGFVRNPSGCAADALAGVFGGSEGARVKASTPFRIVGCESLGFRPSLGMQLLGGRNAARHGIHPGLRTTIAPRQADAGIAKAVITMPLAQQLDPSRLGTVCSQAVFASPQGCPPSTSLGAISLRSPILAKPLQGHLYMRSSGHRFPDLIAELDGEIKLELAARMTFANGRVRFTFDSLPDVPLSRMTLIVDGGRKGVLVNTRDLCRKPASATARLSAQNGKDWAGAVPLRVGCA